MPGRINHNTQMLDILASLEQGEKKPRLLLHVCCAPCSSAVLERLHKFFDIILYFDNPNLDTAEEFDRRALEADRLVKETAWAEEVVIVPYDPETYLAAVKGLEGEREGGKRCAACFDLRLARSAEAAKARKCDWFTTTLTISPRKNASLLNDIGHLAGERAGVPFLPSDFKKQGGFLRSIELSRKFGLYRQDYCGCAFSKEERHSRHETQPSASPSDN